MRRLHPVVLAATAALSCAVAAAPAAATVPEGTEYTEAYFPSGDGVQLHADILRPKGVAKSPVILSIGPYFAHSGQTPTELDPTASATPNERFKDLYTEGKIFERGYALVQVDLPGFGASQGTTTRAGRRRPW
ncbi:MAG: CocE/NonD family hydrolase [Baekduiaceae bacterium]